LSGGGGGNDNITATATAMTAATAMTMAMATATTMVAVATTTMKIETTTVVTAGVHTQQSTKSGSGRNGAPLVPLPITAIVVIVIVIIVIVVVVIVFIVIDNLPDQHEQPSTLLLLLPFRLIVVSVAVATSGWEGGNNSLIPSQFCGVEKGGHHRATAAIAIATIATTIIAPPTASVAIIAIFATPSCWGGVYPSNIQGPTSLA
jgi:hypothetical protein